MTNLRLYGYLQIFPENSEPGTNYLLASFSPFFLLDFFLS